MDVQGDSVMEKVLTTFDEIRASTDEPNRASSRVLERLGMKLVATEPGERWPQLHFALARAAAR